MHLGAFYITNAQTFDPNQPDRTATQSTFLPFAFTANASRERAERCERRA